MFVTDYMLHLYPFKSYPSTCQTFHFTILVASWTSELLWSVCESCKSNHILWLPHWKRLCLDWVIFLANLRPPLRQCDIFLTGKKTFEYSFESFSSRERIGNIIWYEIIDFNCKGRKQILHAWKMFLWRANQMHQLNFDNRFPIESKCFLLIALERAIQRFSASGCQRQNRLLSNSTFDVRHHYLSKSWRLL